MESLLLLAFSLIALGISITGIIIDRPVLQKTGQCLGIVVLLAIIFKLILHS